MEKTLSLLLIEDDPRLAAFTIEYFESHGVKVTHATDGERGLREALRARHDAVLLDLMLPVMDGISVTARADEVDRVLGLELGADDYVPKPFSPRELLARVNAIVRRARGLAGPGRVIRAGPLTLSIGSQTATLRGVPLALTSYEFSILRVLLERRGRILSREQILELAKGDAEESFDRSIDVRISRLRHKLRGEANEPSLIRTVRGVGYMLVCEDA